MKIGVAIASLISLLLLRGINGFPDVNIAVNINVGIIDAPCIDQIDQNSSEVSEKFCRTCSTCGDSGGVCIPSEEKCRGFVPVGPGFCNGRHGDCKCCQNATVYMRDIENTIAHFLRFSVIYENYNETYPSENVFRNLNESMLDAVSDFTQVLVKHIPSLTKKPKLKAFLKALHHYIEQLHTSIKGDKLEKDYGTLAGELPLVREWIGCRNFKQYDLVSFRSYPCGVWTTFHAITIDLKNDQDAKKILPTLYNMVNYFPWCNVCKEHFKKMYHNHDMGFVPAKYMKTPEEVTWWLWSGHNKVTARVGGKDKKGRSQLQFPGIKQCPKCWITSIHHQPVMKSTEALLYLQTVYDENKIVPNI